MAVGGENEGMAPNDVMEIRLQIGKNGHDEVSGVLQWGRGFMGSTEVTSLQLSSSSVATKERAMRARLCERKKVRSQGTR